MKQIGKLLILLLMSILASTGIALAAGSGDRLNPGDTLNIGEYITSPNGQFKLITQGDGNLVLYDTNNKPLWATGTNGKPVSFVIMQGDGNLVLYDSSWKPYWDSKTWGHPGAWLLLQNDGIIVINDKNGGQLWGTKPSQSTSVRYTSICCVQEIYWVNWRTGEDYLQIPVTVELWNSQLQPLSNIKVEVKIVSDVDESEVKFDQTKYTDGNGQAKFGYVEPYPYGPNPKPNPNWDYTDAKVWKVQAFIVDNSGYGTYMEKKFQVYAD